MQKQAARTIQHSVPDDRHKIPEIIAINKADIADSEVMMELHREEPDAYAISVHTGFGIDTLLRAIEISEKNLLVENINNNDFIQLIRISNP